jgi:8-oxo-dGTP pyrophosphatase MutT (NUDIX family)/phosphohistidine phosphatase SixA
MPSGSGSVRRGPRDVVSAGVVVFGPKRSVLLVHRPKYDDWSFPKGKLDPGERAASAAVREVLEETGVRVRLGPPLASQRYPVRGGMKTVVYWTGRPVDHSRDHLDVSTYVPNAEIDKVQWVTATRARGLLTYEHDVETLDEALEVRKRTRTFIVMRHGVARAKRTWKGDDRRRPLVVSGLRQAERLVPVLAAYGVTRLVTSGSTRCTQSLEPYAASVGGKLEVDDVLSEEDATPKAVRRKVADLVTQLEEAPRSAGGLVLCTHRPVLPWAFDALGLEDPDLEKGEMLVVHLRRGRVVATERHQSG